MKAVRVYLGASPVMCISRKDWKLQNISGRINYTFGVWTVPEGCELTIKMENGSIVIYIEQPMLTRAIRNILKTDRSE